MHPLDRRSDLAGGGEKYDNRIPQGESLGVPEKESSQGKLPKKMPTPLTYLDPSEKRPREDPKQRERNKVQENDTSEERDTLTTNAVTTPSRPREKKTPGGKKKVMLSQQNPHKQGEYAEGC